MSSTLNTSDEAHSDVCECAACIYLSPAPAQESQGDCVAAPAKAVQEQGTKSAIWANKPHQVSIDQSCKTERLGIASEFFAKGHKLSDSFLSSLSLAVSHDCADTQSCDECDRRVNEFINSPSFKALSSCADRFFEICAQNNVSFAEVILYGLGSEQRA